MSFGQSARPPPGELWWCSLCHKAVPGEGNYAISPPALCCCAYPRPEPPRAIRHAVLPGGEMMVELNRHMERAWRRGEISWETFDWYLRTICGV